METLPRTFCWTKMGAEAGEELENILARKELERRLGNGIFVWGIGHSIDLESAPSIRANDRLPIVFSKMLSTPKMIDRSPDEVWVWQNYVDSQGVMRLLPSHVVVTSKGKQEAVGKHHYALFCYAKDALGTTSIKQIDAANLTNAASGKPLGYSQVTALVKRGERGSKSVNSRLYPINAVAELVAPYCVRLCNPVRLSKELRSQLSKPLVPSIKDWKATVAMVHEWMKKYGRFPSQQELSLF